jgi:integral membrane protein (TIGR01906 family)
MEQTEHKRPGPVVSIFAGGRSAPTQRILPPLRAVLGFVVVTALPLAFVGSNVRWVTLDLDTYRQGFARYHATERTGLPADQLEAVAQAFIAYFKGPPGQLNPTVILDGQRRPLFTQRESAHMEDVQKVMQLVFRLGLLATLGGLTAAAVLLTVERRAGLAYLGRLLIGGAILTGALLIAVALLSIVDFTELFIRFHEVAFRNDLWMLDPRSDYLLILFPEEFWLDVTLKLAAMSAGEALLTGLIGVALVRR